MKRFLLAFALGFSLSMHANAVDQNDICEAIELQKNCSSSIIMQNRLSQKIIVQQINLPKEFLEDIQNHSKVGNLIAKGEYFSTSVALKKGMKVKMISDAFILKTEDKKIIKGSLVVGMFGDNALFQMSSNDYNLIHVYSNADSRIVWDGFVEPYR